MYCTDIYNYNHVPVSDTTGGSIKYPTRHQCIQDNGSQ